MDYAESDPSDSVDALERDEDHLAELEELAELEDRLLFGETTSSSEPRDGELRPALVAKVATSLVQDAARGEGFLARADINRAYSKRKLTIAECVEVEEQLGKHGIHIVDDEIDEPAHGPAVSPTKSSHYLSETEERDLGRKIQLANRLKLEGRALDDDFGARVLADAIRARELFVETNQRYVWKVARAIRSRKHLLEEDIYQEGMLGLLKATEMYDPERGFRFKTYATWWIEQRIRRAIDNDEREVRLPVHLQERLRRIKRAEASLRLATGRSPELKELAEAVGMDSERLGKLLWRVRATNCVEGDAEIGEDTTAFDVLPDDRAESPFDILVERELAGSIRDVLHGLSPRTERILRLRFGIGDGESQTLEAIGRRFNLTRERIRQIEAKALRTLKHPSRSRKLREFLD